MRRSVDYRYVLVIQATLALVASAGAERAKADPTVGLTPLIPDPRTDPAEAGAMLQGTIPDADFFLLANFFGVGPETLTYQSVTNSSGWSGTLSGTYLGKSLNVTYSGNSSAFPGSITWTSSGSYGSDPWASNGAALITATPTGFQLGFKLFLKVGGNSGSFNVLDNAIVTESEIGFVNTSGTVLVNGSPIAFAGTSYVKIRDTGFYKSDQTDGVKITNSGFQAPAAQGTIIISETLNAIPEPSSLVMLSSGMLGVLGYIRYRRKSAVV